MDVAGRLARRCRLSSVPLHDLGEGAGPQALLPAPELKGETFTERYARVDDDDEGGPTF